MLSNKTPPSIHSARGLESVLPAVVDMNHDLCLIKYTPDAGDPYHPGTSTLWTPAEFFNGSTATSCFEPVFSSAAWVQGKYTT